MSKGLPILLDDEDAHRLIATRAFKKIGITVREASSLSEARKLITESPPLFMIIDRNLNGESGLVIVNEIRGAHETMEVPLIMLSTSEELIDIHAAYASGVNLYLYKEADRGAYTNTLTKAVGFILRYLN